MRVAIVVGHNEEMQGAFNYIGESEFQFNFRIAHKLEMKLSDSVISSKVFLRKNNLNQGIEMMEVAERVGYYKPDFIFELHFNSHKAENAKGFELLLLGEERYLDFAMIIAGRLNIELGLTNRHHDGIKVVSEEQRGYTNLKHYSKITPYNMIIEPCFGGFRNNESIAIFENEDEYVSVLRDAIYSINGSEFWKK